MNLKRPKVDPESVANWSRSYRVSEGLNQRQLAARVKASPGRIGEIERGIVRSQRVARAILDLSPESPEDLI